MLPVSTQAEEVWCFEPPQRFAACRFASYRSDPLVAGQAEAVERTRLFASAGRRRRWQRGRPAGLYLDGDFGVGKTHLLAAAYAAAPGTRHYCRFSDAISLMTLLGGARAIALLAADLVCIDEFELDDPSNTRLADLLLEGLVRRGSRIMVTANATAGDLGHGRFAVADFQRQLQRIAGHFTAVHVPGSDYRRALRDRRRDPHRWGPQVDLVDAMTATELDHLLQATPVARLDAMVRGMHELALADLHPFEDQFAALRFVHLVDRLYDQCMDLRVCSELAIDDIFLPSYRDWAFAAKYRRCCSRLHEMTALEDAPA